MASIFEEQLKSVLKKKARRKLKQALMKLFIQYARTAFNLKTSVAKATFKTLWSQARAATA